MVCYGWDDWLNYPPFEPARDLMAWSYRQIAENDVAVVGVSEALVERIGARRSTMVPNAISSQDYRDLPAPPKWFTQIRGPIAFYAGSLEERIDVRGLAAAARQAFQSGPSCWWGAWASRAFSTSSLRSPTSCVLTPRASTPGAGHDGCR